MRMTEPRLGNIDALRAVAVSIVVLFHFTARFTPEYMGFAGPVYGLGSGSIGVYLFFIISGYCIMMTADRCQDLMSFWAKRFSRVQPAYMAAIVLTFTIVSIFGLPGREVGLGTAIANLAWGNAIPGVASVDGVYWSLVVELKFYIVFGALFFGFRHRIDPLCSWALFTIAGLLVSLFDRSSGSLLFIFPFSATFLGGMLIEKWRQSSVGMKALCLSVYVISTLFGIRKWETSLAVLALFPLAKFVLDRPEMNFPRAVVWIGFISYPLYLVHQNIGLVVIRQTAGVIQSDFARIVAALVVVIGVAWLLSVTVEHRYRQKIENCVAWIVSVFRRSTSLRSP